MFEIAILLVPLIHAGILNIEASLSGSSSSINPSTILTTNQKSKLREYCTFGTISTDSNLTLECIEILLEILNDGFHSKSFTGDIKLNEYHQRRNYQITYQYLSDSFIHQTDGLTLNIYCDSGISNICVPIIYISSFEILRQNRQGLPSKNLAGILHLMLSAFLNEISTHPSRRIELFAVSDGKTNIGAYLWAKHNFIFSDDSQLYALLELFENWCKARNVSENIIERSYDWTSPNDFASNYYGKLFLLKNAIEYDAVYYPSIED